MDMAFTHGQMALHTEVCGIVVNSMATVLLQEEIMRKGMVNGIKAITYSGLMMQISSS